MRIGQMEITVAAGAGVGYNDNVNFSPDKPVGDFFLMPTASLGLQWLITPKNRLSVNLGISYTFYLENPKYNTNSFILDPQSDLKYDIYIGDFVFSIYDKPTVTSTPEQNMGVSNVVNFSQLHNAFGVSVLWDLNKVILNAGAQIDTNLSLNNQFQSQNYNQVMVYGGAFYDVTPTVKIGIKGFASQSIYSEGVSNNYTQYELGLVVEATLSKLTKGFLEVGYQIYTFTNSGTESGDGPVLEESDGNTTNILATGGGGNSESPYFRIGVSNQLNAYYSHALSLSYETQNAAISNYTQTTSLLYTASWTINRKITLIGGLSVQQNVFSGDNTGSSFYWQAQLGFTYSLFRDLPINVSYTRINQIGRENVEGYEQSTFVMGFTYNF